ncbi:MAG: hypothetical protein LBU32_24425 [Clostridiales bacterium]|jgi:hypothetical protein|nr:hypothetical protein [Clostridiales bacterium]
MYQPSVSKEEKAILRDLAKRYSEAASNPRMEKIKKRMIENNSLIPGRPQVLIFEIPWHEMDIEGKLKRLCVSEWAKSMEIFFRRSLFQQEYFPVDMYLENLWIIQKAYSSTGNGLETVEEQLVVDSSNNILSHRYIDQLENEEDVEKFRMPEVLAFPEKDEENIELAREVLDGILDVELRGHDIYHPPWDNIARYRGVNAILYDLSDRPDHLHAIMEHYTQSAMSGLEQMQRLGLLECKNPYLHCTPALTSELPASDHAEGEPYRFKDVWFRSMAQMFSEVSPAMLDEFDLQYGQRLGNECGLTYYGCCEPLDRKISALEKRFNNLRKIGVSPWANEESSAEQIGSNYVYARKPNPSLVALKADPEAIRAETKKTVEICLKYGCPYELVLKDISTVSYRPENLIIWAKTVMETLDEHYA